jgi:RNA repair pathway DNA polymerase beta family
MLLFFLSCFLLCPDLSSYLADDAGRHLSPWAACRAGEIEAIHVGAAKPQRFSSTTGRAPLSRALTARLSLNAVDDKSRRTLFPLLALACSAASLTALTYHYQHQARRSFEALDEENSVRLKSYCYALRSALAIAWIRQRGEAPPMAIGALIAGLTLPEALVQPIRQLIAHKLESVESATMARLSGADTFVADALLAPVSEGTAIARKEISARADAFLAGLLLDATTP